MEEERDRLLAHCESYRHSISVLTTQLEARAPDLNILLNEVKPQSYHGYHGYQGYQGYEGYLDYIWALCDNPDKTVITLIRDGTE